MNICSKSINHLKMLLKHTGDKYIRFGVSGGGCNGFKYIVTSVSEPPRSKDILFHRDYVPIIVCGKSLLYLIGTDVNWVTDTLGSRMEFSNPNASATCGCGETFSV